MTLKFKSSRKNYVYDTSSGYIGELNRLEAEIFDAISSPLSPICPTILRYDFARYDSNDVSEAYDKFYKLFCEKKIFFESDKNTLLIDENAKETVVYDAFEAFFGMCDKCCEYKLVSEHFEDIAQKAALKYGVKILN